MNISPVIIARTKYIDFNQPAFCYPSDIDYKTIERLHNIVDASNLKIKSGDIHHNNIILANQDHIIIGRVMYFNSLEDRTMDSVLDGEDGRQAWGFIGGVISKTQYVRQSKIQTLPDDYFSQSYKKYLYEPHWKDHGEFKGPYRYPYEEVEMLEMDEPSKSFCCGCIYNDSDNDEIIEFVLSRILKGEDISCYTNAEYTAAKNIIDKQITLATVSSAKISQQKRVLDEKTSNVKDTKTGNDAFYEQLKTDFERGNLEIPAVLGRIAATCGYSLVRIKESGKKETIGFGIIKQTEEKFYRSKWVNKYNVEIEDN